MKKNKGGVTLRRKMDQLLAKLQGSDEELPAKIVWARPVSGRGREVSVLGRDNREIAYLQDLSELDDQSLEVAQAELARRYLVPRITKVTRADANYGNRYWRVETDRGTRTFLMKDPAANMIRLTADRLILRDALGNRYEIESLASLDEASRAFIERVL